MFDFEVHSAHLEAPVARLIFAHGAGAGMQHEFMQTIAALLSRQGIEVVLFSFPYMQTMMKTGKRRPPEKAEKLVTHFNAVIDEIAHARANVPTFIGGKSMGGRMATMLLDNADAVIGGVALGYPFHPPGKPEKQRTAHLTSLTKPLLIVQGTRDNFGTKDEVCAYDLSSAITLLFLEDGDHSFKPRKQSGFALSTHIECAANQVVHFIKARVSQ